MSQLDDVKKLRVVEIANDEPVGSMEPVALYKPDGAAFKGGSSPTFSSLADIITPSSGFTFGSSQGSAACVLSSGVATLAGQIQHASALAVGNFLNIGTLDAAWWPLEQVTFGIMVFADVRRAAALSLDSYDGGLYIIPLGGSDFPSATNVQFEISGTYAAVGT